MKIEDSNSIRVDLRSNKKVDGGSSDFANDFDRFLKLTLSKSESGSDVGRLDLVDSLKQVDGSFDISSARSKDYIFILSDSILRDVEKLSSLDLSDSHDRSEFAQLIGDLKQKKDLTVGILSKVEDISDRLVLRDSALLALDALIFSDRL